MSLTYLTLEFRRAMRSPRFLIFTVGMPVLLFLLYTNVFATDDGAVTGVLMVNMTCFGALSGALFAGGRVAVERAAGWQRQLRLTPLSGPGYLAGKGIVAMLLAVPAVVLVPLVGALGEGVQLDAEGWVRVTLGVWLAATPFALIGLLIGQIGTPDAIQPMMSVVMLVTSMLGGVFIPIDGMPPWLLKVADLLPSYWMGQVGRGALTTDLSVDLGHAVLVLTGWVVVLGFAVTRRYRRDSARV